MASGWTPECRAAQSARMKANRPIDHRGKARPLEKAKPKTLEQAIATAGTPPCETCRYYSKCGTEKLSCVDFGTFVEWGEPTRETVVSVKRQIEKTAERRAKAKTSDVLNNALSGLRRLEHWHNRLTDYGKYERYPNRETYVQIMVGNKPGVGMSREEWLQAVGNV